jgi:NAD(P)-dependent dehydrogenase (short-subunit alcohol dehydrogenase family)
MVRISRIAEGAGAVIDLLESYRGKAVVVTGSSSGIGESVARQLLAAGAEVTGVDLVTPRYELERFVQTDLGDLRSIEASAARLPGEVWALFNCAGVSSGAADRQTVLRVNFTGAREFLERTASRMPPGSAIVSTASIAGRDWAENQEKIGALIRTPAFADAVAWGQEHESYLAERDPYRVAKEAVIMYSLSRAFDLCENGIRLNVLAPGVTDTPFLSHSVKVLGEAILKPARPMSRLATAADQAKILIFLNSDWAGYVNGEVIWSDGGGITRRALTG